MKRLAEWSILCAILALVGFGGTLLVGKGAQLAQLSAAAGVEADAIEPELATLPETDASTVGTMSAAAAPAPAPALQTAPSGALSLVGTIELRNERPVVLESSGLVETANVEVGDKVKAGDLLFALDTTDLDRAVDQAENALESARIDFANAGQASDIQVAEAALLAAQQAQEEMESGPRVEVLAAAESSAAAAWAAYKELQEKPTETEINQARASLKLAEIDVQQAQTEYDKIAWLPEAASSSEAANLQRATTALAAAQAAFEEASKPATEAELQGALAAANSAQDDLNELKKKPTPADLAQAKADVAAAETTLTMLKDGAQSGDVRKAELAVDQALSDLAQAKEARANAEVRAPIDGTVMEVNLKEGEMASDGTVSAVLADPTNIWLVVDVEQKDISRIQIGQPVSVSVFAMPSVPFAGTVDRIAPIANSDTGAVEFPVIVNLTDGPLDQLLPGMTASAFFVEGKAEAAPTEAAPTELAPTEAAPTEVAPEETPTEAAPTEVAPEEATPEATATPAA